MKKFWRGFRSAGYIDDNKVRVQKEVVKRTLELVDAGHEAEPQFVEAIKSWYPNISKEELKERITHFHACVSEKQQRDLPRR
jgi:ferritin-like metal-binding protein YciE